MTQQEFTLRTKVEVTTEEFEAINLVYMNSDLDKDEFCKAWSKMNASRVKKAKEEMKQLRERMDKEDSLMRLHAKLQHIAETGEYGYGEITFCHTTNKEEELLLYFGIKTEIPSNNVDKPTRLMHLSDTLYDIHRYFHDKINN